jgi:hypothetical protein
MTVLDSASLHKFLLHFTETLTPELAEHFVKLPSDPEFQQRLDELGSLANEGALSDEERPEYVTYIQRMDVLAILRVKLLSRTK